MSAWRGRPVSTISQAARAQISRSASSTQLAWRPTPSGAVAGLLSKAIFSVPPAPSLAIVVRALIRVAPCTCPPESSCSRAAQPRAAPALAAQPPQDVHGACAKIALATDDGAAERRSDQPMSASAYAEAIWETVPAGRLPAHFALRRSYLLGHLSAGARVLDVGCGEGHFAEGIADAGCAVTGVDIARIPIEHGLDTGTFFSELRRMLRPSGTILLSTPGHPPLALLTLALRPARFARHFDPRSDHLRFYNRHALRSLLADFRFTDIEIRAAGGLPLARPLLLASARRMRW